MMEDELMELQITIDCHKNDVAGFIDNCDTLEELIEELKEYFELNEAYYEERKTYKDMVQKVIDSEVR